MSDFDPFADAPEDAEAQEVAAPPAKKAPAKKVAATPKKENTLSESKVTITLKGGSGFDAPWVVIHADDLQDANDQVSGENAAVLADLLAKVQKAGEHFVGLAPAKAAKQAPVSNAPSRPAGVGEDWTYKEGIGKNGKGWKAWMPPRGSDASPVWL